MNIGDKVKLSKTCRPIYGDPDYLIIKEIKDGKYLTKTYSFWFEEHELVPYKRDGMYTREEIYLVAQRSVHAAINNILSKNNPKPISEIINSEIDTVKLSNS